MMFNSKVWFKPSAFYVTILLLLRKAIGMFNSAVEIQSLNYFWHAITGGTEQPLKRASLAEMSLFCN